MATEYIFPVQLSFLEPPGLFYHCPAEVQERIKSSFDGFFREKVFPLIPEKLIRKVYSGSLRGRPPENGVTVVAAILYIRATGISESFFLEHIHTDGGMQYALRTEDCYKQPFSDRTFSRMRERFLQTEDMIQRDIWDECTQIINESIAKDMQLYNPFSSTYRSAYRIDSLMIQAHAGHMSRLQIFYTVTELAVMLIVSLGETECIPSNLLHYLDPKDNHRYTYYKGTIKELEKELEKLGKPKDEVGDAMENRPSRLALIGELRLCSLALDVVEAKAMLEMMVLPDCEYESFDVRETNEYKLLCRVIEEQIRFDSDNKPIPKEGKEITGSSLQSVYDTVMTYRRKNNIKCYGYVGCFAELYDENGNGCIVWRKFAPNITSDQSFAEEFYDYLIRYHNLPLGNGIRFAVSCDALFTSAALQTKVHGTGIDIYCASTGFTPDPILAEWKLDENLKRAIECPAGKEPTTSDFDSERLNDTITVRFNSGECKECENKDRCKAITGIRGVSKVKIVLNQFIAAKNIKNLDDPTFRKFVNKRNGVESIPSVLRRAYAVDDCPNIGERYERMHFYTSISAYCIVKRYLYSCDKGEYRYIH